MAKKKRLGRRLQDISNISPMKIATPSVPRTAAPETPQKLARVICITSGKGGTGKSILTSNLANCFAKAGQKVVILDSDMGLANIHLLLGIAPQTMRFLHAANEIVTITTPEITAVTDAYAIIKATFRDNPRAVIGLVVNRAHNQAEAKSVFTRLNMIIRKYLNKTIIDFGYILEDRTISESIAARQPVTLLNPNANASRCINEIVVRITSIGKNHGDKLKLTTGAFFTRMQNNLKATM